MASVGRFEASGAKDHVIFGYRNDCCGFWFDPPIQPLAKRYLLVKESRQQRGPKDLRLPGDGDAVVDRLISARRRSRDSHKGYPTSVASPLTNYHKILSSYLPIQIPTLDLVDRRWELDWKTGIR